MVDTLTKSQRSYCMSNIRHKDTSPELFLRKSLWSLGLRGYRLNTKISGKPDLYFPKSQFAVFVDGCFWHKCPKCFKPPKTNKGYWKPKLNRNVARDKEVNNLLKKQGITVLRFWEHELKKNSDSVVSKIIKIHNTRHRK